MKKHKYFATVAGVTGLSLVMLTGCGNSSGKQENANTDAKENTETTETVSARENNALAKKAVEQVKFKEMKQDEADCTITLKGSDAVCDGDGASYDNGVLTISKAGCYAISGTLENGRIEVNADKEDKVELVFGGADITCNDYAPLVVWQADETQVYLVKDTENILRDGETYKTLGTSEEDEEATAVIYSKDDIFFGGEGSLEIVASYKDGITGKDDVQFVSGTYNIEAADDGIVGKDSVSVQDGTFTVNAQGDAIKSTKTEDEEKGFIVVKSGTFDITANCDAIQAESYIWVWDGNFNIQTGGGSEQARSNTGFMDRQANVSEQDNQDSEESQKSQKGLKAGKDISVQAGTFNIDSADDALHSNETMTVAGGRMNITTGDDGVHADCEVYIEKGEMIIAKSYEGVEGQVITIAGGKLDITASDDGVNAASASSEEGMDGPGGNMGGVPEQNGQMEGMSGATQMQGRPDDMPRGDKPDMGGRDAQGGTSDAKLCISGGEIYVNARGDGLDSNGSIEMTGGTVYVDGPENDGNGTLDYNTEFKITGGTLVGAGSSGMMQSISENSSQAGLAVVFDSAQSADTEITLKDSDGKEVLSYKPSKSFTSIIFSTGEMEVGETYEVFINGTSYKSVELTSVSTMLGEPGNVRKGGNMGNAGGQRNT